MILYHSVTIYQVLEAIVHRERDIGFWMRGSDSKGIYRACGNFG